MATALLVISALGTLASAAKQKKISEEQKKQNKLSNKIAAVSRARKIKQSIASARIQQGQIQSAGFQLGVSGSTAVQGAAQSIQGDTASAVGQSNLETVGSGFIADSQNRISSLQSGIALANTVSSIAGGIAGNAQAVGTFEDFLGLGE